MRKRQLTGKKQKVIKTVLLTIIVLLSLASISLAVTDHFRDTMELDLDKLDYVKGPIIQINNNINVAGTIDGSALLVGSKIIIEGTVDGTLIALGQEVIIDGIVLGNLITGAQDIRINGLVKGDIIAAGQRVHSSETGIIGRDIMFIADTFFHAGHIHRQILGAATTVVINGGVKDDVKIYVEKLDVRAQANIQGELVYSGPNQAQIADSAQIVKGIEWKDFDYRITDAIREKEQSILSQIFSLLLKIAAVMLVWFALFVIRDDIWSGLAKTLQTRTLRTLGIGLMTLLAVPIAAVALFFTGAGIPLALIILAAYSTALYSTQIIIAATIGYLIANKLGWVADLHGGVWYVVLGLVIFLVITSIPIVGAIVWFLTLVCGLGTILVYFLTREDDQATNPDELADY